MIKEETDKISIPQEIERKFLVKNLPENLDNYDHFLIRQGYLTFGTDGSEIRLRDKSGIYYLTVKSSGDLIRSEFEISITQEQFNNLWPATVDRRIEKTRYIIPDQYGNIIELDIYGGKLSGLIVTEIEFNSKDEALSFKAPEWLDRDVTKVAEMKNQSLAKNGIPKYVQY